MPFSIDVGWLKLIVEILGFMGGVVWAASKVTNKVTVLTDKVAGVVTELHDIRREVRDNTDAMNRLLQEHGNRISRIEGRLGA